MPPLPAKTPNSQKMMNKFHVYRQRHVFLDDDHIGKWNVSEKTVRLRPEYGEHADRLKAWFMRTQGIPAKVLVGEEVFKDAVPPMEFPDEIRALMTPQLGDLTPEAVDWARENFPKDEFRRRYEGRVPIFLAHETPEESPVIDPTAAADALGDEAEASNVPPADVPEPKKRGRKPKALADLEADIEE